MSTRGGPFRTTAASSNNKNNNNNSHTSSNNSSSSSSSSCSRNRNTAPGASTNTVGVGMNTNRIAIPMKKSKKMPTSATTTGGGGGGKMTIQIRPYQKPPQLPANYYESTAETMLSGCLLMIQERLKQSSSFSSSSSSFSLPHPPLDGRHLSLQSAYTTSVDLVRHQLGLRFYQDIVQNMIAASILILPITATTSHQYGPEPLDAGPSTLLPYVTQQYAIYMEYILLLKHICLPLDRTHLWQWNTSTTTSTSTSTSTSTTTGSTTTTANIGTDEDFIQSCIGNATATTTATPTSGSAVSQSPSPASSSLSSSTTSMPLQSQQHPTQYLTMWSVGLAIFIRRLQYLKYDTPIYQQWISLFINDWNPTTDADNHSLFHTKDPMKKEERLLLHNTWYMWQDLCILSTLPIQSDLQEYWMKQSVEWQTTTTTLTYSIANFVTFCHDRMQHIHLYYRNIIQPIGWLYHIFDTYFIQHHISVQFLFNDRYFFPLLQEHLFHQNHDHSNNNNNNKDTTISTLESDRTTNSLSPKFQSNTIQQLWILAGRIPNGQVLMSQAIQRYAKQEGLIRIRYAATETATAITASATNHANTNSNTTTAVEDLLDLQYALNALVLQLPKGMANTLTKNMNTNATTNTATTTVISFKSVWEEVVNVDIFPMSIAEQLAKFLDSTLRSNKKMDSLAHPSNTNSNTNNNNTATLSPTTRIANTTTSPTILTSQSSLTSEFGWLQRIIHGIFVPLQSKDIFEAFYKRDLAKRLLWNRIISMDAEKFICSLLKAECGTAYTSKIEGMFQDVDWSREIMMVYKQSQLASTTTFSENGSFGNDVEVEVQVLTTGYWPVYPVYSNLIIPDTLKIPQEQFESHYHNKYQGRRMVWQYALGHCVVRVNGYNKPYELLVSLCQALVLIQFTSDKVCISLPQLLQATGLEDRNEMERILQSLALGKDGTRILRKLEHTAEPGKKTKILMTIDDRDQFMINTKFESKSRRIRITNIMMKETKEEREKTVETVSRDRLYLIDAVLVRIMKARKTILHQALIPQVLEQIKVPAQSSDVKKRIESLIEREYMERDSKDHNRYNYLA